MLLTILNLYKLWVRALIVKAYIRAVNRIINALIINKLSDVKHEFHGAVVAAVDVGVDLGVHEVAVD